MLTNLGSVLVVGAGPTGLAAALTLAQRGVAVRVIDRSRRGTNTSRAAVVHARTLEVLEASGVTSDVLDLAVRVPRFELRDRDRRLGRLDLSSLPTAFPFTAMISQADTERILRDRLAAAGVEVDWQHEVVDLVERDDRVEIGLTDAAGRRHELTADVVLGADGMHSRVRELAGIDFPGSAYEQGFVLADVELDWPVPRDTVSLTFSPAGLLVTAPLPGGHFRVVATADDPPERPSADQLQEMLQVRARSGTVHSVAWSGRFRVHHRLASSFGRGRVFLAGDAAHVHSPAGGQGMNLGIQDAVCFAELLAAGADPGTYDARRRPAAQRVLRLTDFATRAATRDSTAGRIVRNTGVRVVTRFPPARRRLALALSELDDELDDRSRAAQSDGASI